MRIADGGAVPPWQPLASAWQPLAQRTDMTLRTGGKKSIFALLIGIMAKLTIETRQCDRILRRAVEADPSAFYVGADGRAVTGGRLTAEAAEGMVTIRSNRLSEKELRRIFAAFLPEAQPE